MYNWYNLMCQSETNPTPTPQLLVFPLPEKTPTSVSIQNPNVASPVSNISTLFVSGSLQANLNVSKVIWLNCCQNVPRRFSTFPHITFEIVTNVFVLGIKSKQISLRLINTHNTFIFFTSLDFCKTNLVNVRTGFVGVPLIFLLHRRQGVGPGAGPWWGDYPDFRLAGVKVGISISTQIPIAAF